MQSTGTILDGKLLSATIEGGLKQQVGELVKTGRRQPGLAVIIVGENPASLAYVGTKEKVACRIGFSGSVVRLSADSTKVDVAEAIDSLNNNPAVDGILLQLPLPKHLAAYQHELVAQIAPHKDVDGLTPINQGRLALGLPGHRPCTPLGVMALLKLAHPAGDLAGKNAVVVGRSHLVGKPAAALLLEQNATVTVAHSKTAELPSIVAHADIVVAAVGIPEFIKGDWIRPGATVIDVGINRVADGRLVGDVEFASAASRAGAITPVPGGVGPMTVIKLMENTLSSYKKVVC